VAGVFNRTTGRELEHLARLLSWTGDPHMKSYLGAPHRASRKAGAAMLQYRVETAMALFRLAYQGERVTTTPLLWFLRFLQRLPE